MKNEADNKDFPDSYYQNIARNKAICVISRLAESEYKKKLDEIESLD